MFLGRFLVILSLLLECLELEIYNSKNVSWYLESSMQVSSHELLLEVKKSFRISQSSLEEKCGFGKKSCIFYLWPNPIVSFLSLSHYQLSLLACFLRSACRQFLQNKRLRHYCALIQAIFRRKSSRKKCVKIVWTRESRNERCARRAPQHLRRGRFSNTLQFMRSWNSIY